MSTSPSLLEILSLGLILSADSFSAALAMGSRRFTTLDLLKFAAASGVAEALATLIGHLAGSKVFAAISDYDHWVAFGLLAAVAAHMAYDGVREIRGRGLSETSPEFHGVAKVLAVSLATSMDAFGVGIGLGITDRPIWPFLGAIAGGASLATVVGLYVGRHVSKKMGPVFTLMAAGILAYLSIQMLKI